MPYEVINPRYRGMDSTMASFVIRGEEGRFLLIECGPAVQLDQLLDGMRDLGLDPALLTDILVTHIHLDHAGAAGHLATRYGATVHVHEAGAPFLLEPDRLNSSSRRVYGDTFDELMGEAIPVPAGQLRSVQEGDVLRLHGHALEVIATPGHAGSHVSYLLDGERLFAGDSAGIRFPGCAHVKPATAPPEIDLEAWSVSIGKMLAAGPEELVLTHFGSVPDARHHLFELDRQNAVWSREVLRGLQAGENDQQLVDRINRLADRQMEQLDETDRMRYRVSSDHAMTAAGLARYWRKNHPAALTAAGFPLGRPARIAVLASGRGNNAISLIGAFPRGSAEATAVTVISDQGDAPVLQRAGDAGVHAVHLPWSSRAGFEAALERHLADHEIDLVCLAGFMRLLSPGFTGRWQGRLLNIHPSLLPLHRGLDPQGKAIAAGDAESGCSVHFVDAGMDTGAVVLQRSVPVLAGDDADSLGERIMQQELVAYPEAVRKVIGGTA